MHLGFVGYPPFVEARPRVGRVAAAPAFAGGGQHGIDIDQVPQLAGPAVGHGGAEHAAVAVHDEDAVVEFLGVQRAQHVGDVGFQVDGGREQVGALAHACQRDGMRAVAGADQRVQRVAPVPGAAPGAVNEQVVGHGGSSFRAGGRQTPVSAAVSRFKTSDNDLAGI